MSNVTKIKYEGSASDNYTYLPYNFHGFPAHQSRAGSRSAAPAPLPPWSTSSPDECISRQPAGVDICIIYAVCGGWFGRRSLGRAARVLPAGRPVCREKRLSQLPATPEPSVETRAMFTGRLRSSGFLADAATSLALVHLAITLSLTLLFVFITSLVAQSSSRRFILRSFHPLIPPFINSLTLSIPLPFHPSSP